MCQLQRYHTTQPAWGKSTPRCWIESLLFPDDVVLMAPLAVDQFAAECEVAGMRISTSRSSRRFEGE